MKVGRRIKCLILMTILILSFATMSQLVSGQGTTNSATTSSEFKRALDSVYLKELGLISNVTAISSSVNPFQNTANSGSAGFTYQAKIQTGNESFTVQSSVQQSKTSNSVRTASDERVSGAQNYHYSIEEVNKTSNSITTTNRIYALENTNASGTYSFNLNATVLTDTKTGHLVSATGQVQQNQYPMTGNFKEIISPDNDNTTRLVVTPQNGIQQTFVSGTGLPSQSSTTDTSKVVSPDDIVPWITDHGTNPTTASRNGLKLSSNMYWWLPSFDGFNWLYWTIAALITGIVGASLGLVGALVAAVAYGIQGYVLARAGDYTSTMDPYNVHILYVTYESKVYDFFGLQIELPWCWETGYYTNYVVINDINTYTGWYYFPLDCMCFGHQDFPGTWDLKHADVWSLDPPTTYYVTLLAYDLSSNSYVDEIPISLSGEWAPTSWNALSIPEGNIQFEAVDANGGGAFDCFYDGTTYYGNQATIAIEADTTIIAYYYYIPTYTLTVSAIDQYNNGVWADVYVDGNWVGTTDLSMQIPIGYHTLECGAWDLTGWEQLQGYFGYDGQSLLITSDTSVTAYYLYW